jgi:predicted nucleic acid-binding protein
VTHLDTSFLVVSLLRGSAADRRHREWLSHGEELAISAVGWAEFLCGPVDARALELADRILGQPVAVGAAEAVLAARLFKEGGRRRGSLADCMIAATAIEVGASLAAANPRDFARFTAAGLAVVRS